MILRIIHSLFPTRITSKLLLSLLKLGLPQLGLFPVGHRVGGVDRLCVEAPHGVVGRN